MAARAVVLYGRVGTRDARAASLAASASADPLLWRACAQTAMERVITPWRQAGRVDIFVQSWNVELAREMDAFWAPVASDHAAQNSSSLVCPVRLKLCERTMWALLGMKRALDLRSRWEVSAAGRLASPHVAVLVARHDVYWRTDLPPLFTEPDGVRLWLPFDCRLRYCREGQYSAPTTCAGNKVARNATAPPSDWIMLDHSQSTFFGTRCEATAGGAASELPPICAATVLIDWWFVGDRALASGFGETFDEFEAYSNVVQRELGLAVSAPHQYWGLYFFRTMKLRGSTSGSGGSNRNRASHACQVGHVLMHALDFTLGRFLPAGVDARSRCTFGEAWRPYWQPPRGCDASAIPGYLTSCPGVPSRPVLYRCPTEQ